MEVKFTNAFEKDLKAVSDRSVILKTDAIIKLLRLATSVRDLPELKKLKGHKDCYRIRIGNFRMGIKVVEKTVWIARLMLRKDIYKHFP